MAYRRFDEKTTFDDAQSSTLDTAEALAAHPDTAVSAMAKPLDAQLEQVDALEIQRRKAHRAAIRASARCRAASAIASDEIGELAKDVLGAVRQDRRAPLYVAIFPTAPADIKNMSIEPKMKEVDRMIGALAEKATPAALRKEWAPRLAAVAARGKAALAEREAAAKLSDEASAATAAWIAATDRERRKVDGALTTHAADRNLPIDFNDLFFPPLPPAPKPARKNGKAKDAEPKDGKPDAAPANS